MAAVFVGVAVAKYRASRSPHAQGFVEVDQVCILHRTIICIPEFLNKRKAMINEFRFI